MEFPSQWIVENLGIAPTAQYKIFYTLITLGVIFIFRLITVRIVLSRIKDTRERYYYSRGITYTFSTLFFITLFIIWLTKFRSIATILGLFAAAITIALKDPIVNMAGWLFILIRKPFSVGDRIAIGEHKGDVIDTRLFQFTINEIGNWVDADQSTGRIIHIPNGKVFTESQANYTQGFSHLWNEIAVVITFESNWKKAKQILEEIVNRHAAHFSKTAERKLIEASKKYMILYTKLTPIVYTSVKDSGVLLTKRYLITPRRRRGSRQEIWEDVLDEFAKYKNIDFAYPTQRIYYEPVGNNDNIEL